jgi:hypothetical protein
MDPDLAKKTYHILKRTFPQYNKYSQQTLAELLLAMFSHQRLTLRHIASRLLGTTNVKHKLKRLQNFLDKITLDEQFWQSYVQTLFCLPYMKLRSQGRITVLIDATSLKDDVWILAASISYRGRSLPVYLRQWKGVNTTYDYWKRVEEFVGQLKALLPDDLDYVLIGDGGFEGARMFALCRRVGWDQVIRINGTYSIKTKGGREYIQLSLFDDGYYRQAIIGQTNPTKGLNLAVCSSADSERRWYLATSVDPEKAAKDYTRRMWIEQTFKDLKSVLKWETYTAKFPTHRRLEKLVAISCLSYGFQLCLGTQVTVPPSEEKKTSLLQRFRHIYSSAYRKTKQIYSRMVAAFYVRHYRNSHTFARLYG